MASFTIQYTAALSSSADLLRPHPSTFIDHSQLINIVDLTLMASAFDSYCSPPSHALYSPQYFNALTFEQCSALQFPSIVASGAIRKWGLSPVEHASASANVILHTDWIPHYHDLQPICAELQRAFNNGFRSVIVTAVVRDLQYELLWNFVKVLLHLRHRLYGL
jgi:hypothetical protein